MMNYERWIVNKSVRIVIYRFNGKWERGMDDLLLIRELGIENWGDGRME